MQVKTPDYMPKANTKRVNCNLNFVIGPFYAFNAVLRVDVNDVKPFQNLSGKLPADHFLDPQSMPRLLITTN